MEALKSKNTEEKKSPAIDLLGLTRSKSAESAFSLRRNITITTIIFGLSEVQITGLKGAEHKLAQVLGVEASEIASKLIGNDLTAFFHGSISEDEYLNRIIRANNWKANAPVLKKAIRENFREIEGTRAIIERLKRQGFRLGLLSVHGKEWIEYASRKFDYHRLFDVVMYSFEAGVSKPDRKAYEMILHKLGAIPEECLFIDDSLQNLAPASQLGMETIHFQSASQLDLELRRRGVYESRR